LASICESVVSGFRVPVIPTNWVGGCNHCVDLIFLPCNEHKFSYCTASCSQIPVDHGQILRRWRTASCVVIQRQMFQNTSLLWPCSIWYYLYSNYFQATISRAWFDLPPDGWFPQTILKCPPLPIQELLLSPENPPHFYYICAKHKMTSSWSSIRLDWENLKKQQYPTWHLCWSWEALRIWSHSQNLFHGRK
jgi:hypothetical protein